MDRGREQATALPLCVDLDGTLVKTDLLIEALFALLKRKPWLAFVLPFWLLKGKAHFKSMIFGRVELDVTSLPYHEDFLAYLHAQKALGRKLVLTTATSRGPAERVARHLGVFDQVVASDASVNMAGKTKAAALVREFGPKQFDYAANAYVDINVWREAAAAHIVSPAPGLARAVEAVCRVEHVYEVRKSSIVLVLKAMRVHQWMKNILIFAPLVFAHRLGEPKLWMACAIAFIAFSLTSSSVYLLNDLLDLDSDRRHPEKRRRPFAAGDLPLISGLFLAPALLVVGMTIAWLVSPSFFAVLAGYYFVTSVYSLRLKQVPLADVLLLAFLYAWRVFAGSIATEIQLSSWFLAFFGFLFLSLALVKRAAELILMIRENLPENPRRGYLKDDLGLLGAFGAASGTMSVLVLALYLNHEQVMPLYAHPQVLWLVCPFLLYWVCRMWLKAYRGKMHSDPLVFAMKDRVSYAIFAVMVTIWFLAHGGL